MPSVSPWTGLGSPRFAFERGLHDIGNGAYAWLQPDGGWGWSNAGLIVSGDESLLVDTLFDLPNTREMLDAMKKRHSYGATDNIILDYRLRTGGREYLQGDILTADGDFRLSVRVIGTTPIRQIDIIRDQTFLYNRQNLEADVGLEFVDADVEPGEHLYYVRVIQVDGNMAWSSPIWVTVE